MGQRLNLEITIGENVLANAYYHWSGYKTSSLRLVESALKKFEEGKRFVLDRYELALDMLENTGAKFTRDELMAWNYHTFTDFSGKVLPRKVRSSDGVNRNDGIISITSVGINETRSWEEARVSIDIEKKTVLFDAIRLIEGGENELVEDYETNPDEIPEISFNFKQIPFDKFDDIKNKIFSLIDEEIYRFKHEGSFYSFIE